MSVFFRWIICSALAFTFPVRAESRDEELLRKGLETAGRVVGEQLVKGFLDKMFPVAGAASAGANAAAAGTQAGSNAAQEGAKSGVTVGGAFLFVVSLGLSIDEFGKAKTDKGKGFAVANAVVAGIAMVFPVAGLIAAAVVLVVRLVDGAVSAQHAKQLMEIYTRINNYYQEAIKFETQMLESEKAKFQFAFEQLKTAKEHVEAGGKYLKENCMAVESMNSLEKIDSCLKSTIQVVEEFQRLVDYSQSLLEPTTRILKTDLVFKTLKIDPLEFQKSIDDNRGRLKEMRTGLNETLQSYGSFLTEVIVKNAYAETMKELPRVFKGECLSKARRLSMQALVVLRPKYFPNVRMIRDQQVSDLHQMRDLMDQFQYSGCSTVPSGDEVLDDLYNEMNSMFLSLYEEVLKEGA